MKTKMVEDQKKEPGRQPDFKGKLDFACWKNKDKNGNTYLSIKIADNVNLFKNEPKPKQTTASEDVL